MTPQLFSRSELLARIQSASPETSATWQGTPLSQSFRSHFFGPNEHHVDLYHVYDNLSQTPFEHGIGIECGDPDNYIMNAWHVITPLAIRKHLNWQNREATQFISCYDSVTVARREFFRRKNQEFVPGSNGVETREPQSVRMAQIRIPRGTRVWFFSRTEVLEMMATLGGWTCDDMSSLGATEWIIWGFVPEEYVLNRQDL